MIWRPHFLKDISLLESVQRRPIWKILYISLVRSQLTYCSTIYRPHLIKDISLLESFQRLATKCILNDSESDYTCKSCVRTLHMIPLMMVYELNDLCFS